MAGSLKKASQADLLEEPLIPLVPERIPAEVWLEIIEDSNLTAEDITNLTFVSRFVRWIAQPMLFRNMNVSMFSRAYGTPGPTTFYLERLKARLAFATQPNISHGVRSVVIRCSSVASGLVAEFAVDASQLFEAVFTSLPCFHNLRSFSTSNCRLSGRHFDVLAQIPHLSGLHFHQCSGSGDLGLSRFRLKELSLHGTISGTFAWWTSLMKSTSIQSLSYSTTEATSNSNGTDDSLNLFFPALSIGPRMVNLTVLRLPSAAPQTQCYMSALQRCPNIECLIIEPGARLPASSYPPFTSLTLPRLRAISASSAFIAGSFPSGRQLKQIRIEEPFPHRSNASILTLITQFPSVQELVLPAGMGYGEVEPARGIFSLYLPGLERLCIRYEGFHSAYRTEQVSILCALRSYSVNYDRIDLVITSRAKFVPSVVTIL